MVNSIMQHASEMGTGVPTAVKIGYLVPEFPNQTHIIFWREITLLREMGVEVLLLSTRRPPPRSCPHEFAVQAEAETHYTYPPPMANLRTDAHVTA